MKKQRESHYVRYARLAYTLAQNVLPRYSHANSPKTYTQPQLLAAVLLGFYVDLPYRDMEEWLLASDKVCAVLEFTQVPDYSTLCRTFQRVRLSRLQSLHRHLLRWLGVQEDSMVVDATAFRGTRASQHYLSRTGRTMSDYVKGFYIVGVSQQYILGWRYARGPGGNDAQYLNSLRRQAHPYGTLHRGRHEWILLGDKGFDGIQARSADLIPPRQGQHPVVRLDRRHRLDLTGQARLDGFFGQRWKVETVISVMKRKSGDVIRSRSLLAQRREVAFKALLYNLHRYPFRTLQQSN
jgi:IS5 family transposase